MDGSNRWPSQRSIYDYPEHLNPFYEEENHKRLRFWKIGSDKSNRSNSFSLDGLKGLWSFKTFKLKKRSSTLGINKTSESPPMLRREDRYERDENNRHTVGIGLNRHFNRGAHCRSSLQDLDSMSRRGFFLNRNDRFRSTMQEISQPSRYPSNSSIGSPNLVLRSKYNKPTISKGSSQLSVNSNPFDDDYDSASTRSPERMSLRRAGKKKRKAPLPPILSNKTEVAVEDSTKQNEALNITSLTAEIESFVRTADMNTTESEQREESETRKSPENNNFYSDKSDELSIEIIQSLGETEFKSNKECKTTPVEIFDRAPTSDVEFKTFECTPSVPFFGSVPQEVDSNPEKSSSVDIITSMNSAMDYTLGIDSNRVEFLDELKIRESNDDLTTTKPNTCLARNNEVRVSTTVDKFDVQTIESNSMELENEKNKKKPNTPHRRRSVKEIIESINKCQSLLKINQNYQSNIGQEDLYVSKRSFTECQRVPEMNNNNNSDSNKNDEPSKVEWNPVPKPRRHRSSVQGPMNKYQTENDHDETNNLG